jgi:hypothetical protein
MRQEEGKRHVSRRWMWTSGLKHWIIRLRDETPTPMSLHGGADVFSTAVGMVIVTTLLTPPVLRRAFAGVASPDISMQESS